MSSKMRLDLPGDVICPDNVGHGKCVVSECIVD